MSTALRPVHSLAPSGIVGLKLITPDVRPSLAAELFRLADPLRVKLGINTGTEWLRRYKEANLPNIMRGLSRLQIAEQHGIPTFFGALYAQLIRNDGDVLDYGLVSSRVVTTAGVNFLVDAWQNSVELEILKYHGIGTTNTAENVADTALAAEVTTGLNPDSVRATGSLGEGASANIVRTVGTNTVDASLTIVEHGLFSQAATGGGTLWDRSIFAGIGMVSGNQLQTTYDGTFTAGS